jgi:metal-responsive CopG/Arc/MetJ family transcriptional regulator
MNRNQIIGIRTTDEFLKKFDGLCDRLGHNRSEVIRYCLKKFLMEHFNSPERFKKARSEMF